MASDNIEQSRHDAALAKRQAEKDRLEQSTAAFQSALKKVFKKELADEDTRAKIHQETQNGKRGLGVNPAMDQYGKAAKGGGYGDLDDVDTGLDRRYWEVDDD